MAQNEFKEVKPYGKYSNKYLAEHEAEIEKYRAAQATFKRVLDGAKLPKMDALVAESRTLAAQKKAAYGKYRAAKNDMQEIVTAKANIDHLLGITDERNKEKER
jgi:seryl-tRNA synthetase